MRILNISLDKTILEKDSAVQRRLISLAEAVGEIVVCVPGARTESLQLSEHLRAHAVGGPKPIQFFGLWLRARQELTWKKYDLITVQDAHFLGFLAAQLAEKYSVPLEVQIHGFEKMGGGRARLARFVFCKAKKIRMVSERLRRELYSIFHLPYSKIYVLPVYTQIDPPQKKAKRNTVPVPFTFLTVGRLVHVKNIGLQLRALAQVAEKIPHVRLRVVGDGPLKEVLRLEVKSLKLEDKITFEGYQKDLNRYYEEADAFLLTSDSEGWGLVALEAAAYGLSIIMTNVGLANEVLHHDTECIVIPVGDAEQLSSAMKDLVDDPALRERLGKGALSAFQKLPKPEEQIERQVEAWRSIIS